MTTTWARGNWRWLLTLPPAALLAVLAVVLPSVGAPQTPPAPAPASSGSARAPDKPAPDGGAATEAPEPLGPSAYCTKRFLATLEGLAGSERERLGKAEDKPPGWDVAGDFQDGGIHIKPSEADAGAQTEWHQGVKTALDKLTSKDTSKKVEVDIALVADPIDSALEYHFDTTLQGLRLGLEARPEGLYRDRSWLPWHDPAVEEADRARSATCRRTTPGVLLFRGAEVGALRAVVLLVGESPTTGIHPTAMASALEVAAALDAPAIKILGPTFSGSVSSLRGAMQRWARGAHSGNVESIDIVTGAATGPGIKGALEGSLKEPPLPPRTISVTFAATVVPQRAVECAFLHFLQETLHVDASYRQSQQALLGGVAFLHESGTEFGALRGPVLAREPSPSWRCDLAPEVRIGFPLHVSALRDAYEDMDRRQAPAPGDAIARRTTLDVSLRDTKSPLDAEGALSPKSTFSSDVALSHVLTAVAHEGVRYVAIQSTAVADAIFLARKIRDVAPDVRLAFFNADALLTHPDFQQDLLGSFVVSPYPFLGAADLSPRGDDKSRVFEHDHAPFDNALALGVYNAALALGPAHAKGLREYFFAGEQRAPLPIWISVISRTGMLPVAVRRAVDCDHTIYPTDAGARDAGDALCRELERVGGCPTEAACEGAWQTFEQDHDYAKLQVDPDVTPPKLWQFVYAVLMLGAVIDLLRQGSTREEMSIGRPDRFLDHISASGVKCMDRMADIGMGRATWAMHAVLRTLVFVLALGYMTFIHWWAVFTYGDKGLDLLPCLAGVAGLGVLVITAGSLGARVQQARAWYGCVATLAMTPPQAALSAPPGAVAAEERRRGGTRYDRIVASWASGTEWVGLADPSEPSHARVAAVSKKRIHWVAVLSGALTVVFVLLLVLSLVAGATWATRDSTGKLFVLRSLPLFDGASPVAPILLSLASVYGWIMGRMARLRLAHSVSMIAPADGVDDGTSTPLRAILFPTHTGDQRSDGGFTRVERTFLDAIWRPNSAPQYVIGLFVIGFLPFVLFLLKRPSTLEGRPAILFAWLGLSGALLSFTLLQLMQQWFALEHLLKRIMAHPLGKSFDGVDAFVREPLDDQLSRSPSDVLRMVSCAKKFEDLIALGRSNGALPELADPAALADLDPRIEALVTARLGALCESAHASGDACPDCGSKPDDQSANGALGATNADRLGQQVLEAARVTMLILEPAWQGQGLGTKPKSPEGKQEPTGVPAPAPGGDEPSKAAPAPVDALTPVAAAFSPPEVLAWLREAQCFVATVVAVLVNRHVRHFRFFLYALTGCALLLLLALVSYPFEPHRLLLTCIWVMMGTVVASGFWIYVELDRNTLLSHISGSTPGQINVDGAFALRVFTWGVLPLLSVAAAQYPQIAGVLFRWVEPFARALR